MKVLRKSIAVFSALAIIISSLSFCFAAAFTNGGLLTILAANPSVSLYVNIPNENNWSRNNDGWTVEAADGANVYYKLSGYELSDWGDYTDSDTMLWQDGNSLPEGLNYIKFWAVSESTGDVNDEIPAMKYMLDKTAPSDFVIKTQGYSLVAGTDIVDIASGVQEINYIVDGNSFSADIINIDGNNKVNFSIALTPDMQGKTVTVQVVDGAGNIREASTQDSDTADITAPLIDSYEFVNIDRTDESTNANTLSRKMLGSDSDAQFRESYNYYVSQISYIKVKVIEENLSALELEASVDGRILNVTIPAESLNTPEGIEANEDEYYVPFKLIADKRNEILESESVSNASDNFIIDNLLLIAIDTYGHESDDTNSVLENDFIYDGLRTYQDCIVEASFDPSAKNSDDIDATDSSVTAYFDGDSQDNNIFISLEDDLGITDYKVELYYTDNSNVKELKYSLVENDLTEIKYSSSGEYAVPVTYVDGIEFNLSDDGAYELEISITDIGGNSNNVSYKYIVDTTPPVIDNYEYIATPNTIRYLTFGMFAKDKLQFKIKASDGTFGSGVDSQQILLYWDKSQPYTASSDGEWFAFDNLSDVGSGKPYFSVCDKLGNEQKYYFNTVDSVGDDSFAPATDLLSVVNKEIPLVIEKENPICVITASGKRNGESSYKTGLNGNNTLYFGIGADAEDENNSRNALNFYFSDNVGIAQYTINIYDSSGAIKKTLSNNFTKENEAVKNSDVETIYIDDLVSDEYRIDIEAYDLAGNEVVVKNTDFAYDKFVVDNDAPEITDSQYHVSKSDILNFITFGIFGKESISISIKAIDNTHGSGIQSVQLYWDKANAYSPEINSAENTYTFNNLAINTTGKPYIVVTDQMGNVNNYYFTPSSKDSNKQIGELIKNDEENGVILMLEDESPDIELIISDSYKKYDVNGEIWYADDIQYQVNASDTVKGSPNTVVAGLESVKVNVDTQSGSSVFEKTETQYNGLKFSDSAFLQKAYYTYDLNKEGNYVISAQATDNALNSSNTSIQFSIDKNNPEIKMFRFANLNDEKPFYKHYYGYFFKEDTPMCVYVDDEGVSSGLNRVIIHLNSCDSNSQSYEYITYADALLSDSYGRYAQCAVPVGFKGTVNAEVIDNVDHSSGVIDADGNIIEDYQIHKNTSSVVIKANKSTDKKDADSIDLYNSNIPLTIYVTDTFSGISTIEWSISDDNESGTISVNSDGIYSNNSSAAVVDEKSVKRDHNLITAINFDLSVDNNSNGNKVHIKLTDKSGNVTECDSVYSIDTTAPLISAVKSNTNPSNGNYYNTTQHVVISITERNFNPDEVKVLVNGSVQNVKWNESKASVTTDTQIHTGSFEITSDGRYTFSVDYIDMAGNEGKTFSEPEFVIDCTSPVIENNFADFGKLGDSNIYFNIQNKDKVSAHIGVVETNFYEQDMGLVVYRKAPGSSHTDDGWEEYQITSIWKQDGDKNHSIDIPFFEDGVYKIVMSPVDRANNDAVFSKGSQPSTAIFEIDFTAPVVSQRNGDPVSEDNVSFSDLYAFERRNAPLPNVSFFDTNIDRIEYSFKKYTPEYTNDKEMGYILPDESSGTINANNENATQIFYTVNDFDKDGVYSVIITAYDKAGNPSKVNSSTYTRMINTNVLAYIENSNRKTLQGWYSFEDENGPISKQPTSFTDLNIVVFSKKSTSTSICLVDKSTDVSTDTQITSDESSLFDDFMYDIGAYRYVLNGSYFAEHFTEDADTSLYLRVNNGDEHIDLGEMYIDNTKPKCDIPEHFKSWGWFKGVNKQTIVFSNVSEVLDFEKTVAFVNGKQISISNENTGDTPLFEYDVENSQLKLTLDKGTYKVGLLLTDRAGNQTSIKEVQHLSIGNSRVWVTVVVGILTLLTAIASLVVTRVIQNYKRKYE